jgi:hypothetical protein
VINPHPVTTFAGTLDVLDEIIADCRRDGSRAGYFAALYRTVTTTVADRARDGAFDDANRMEGFVAAFAQRYFDAYFGWRSSVPVSASWQVAFDHVGAWRPIVLQHLLAGMNAHIQFDLGVTAAELAGSAAALPSLRADFLSINEVLASLVDKCQNAVCEVSPFFALVDRLGERHDELVTGATLEIGRDRAWRAAERLVQVPQPDRAREITRLDVEVARAAHLVFAPGRLASVVLFVVRLGEYHKVPTVIDTLLQSS